MKRIAAISGTTWALWSNWVVKAMFIGETHYQSPLQRWDMNISTAFINQTFIVKWTEVAQAHGSLLNVRQMTLRAEGNGFFGLMRQNETLWAELQ